MIASSACADTDRTARTIPVRKDRLDMFMVKTPNVLWDAGANRWYAAAAAGQERKVAPLFPCHLRAVKRFHCNCVATAMLPNAELAPES